MGLICHLPTFFFGVFVYSATRLSHEGVIVVGVAPAMMATWFTISA
jgi:hypothetical protein